LLALGLALGVVACLYACGGSEETPEDTVVLPPRAETGVEDDADAGAPSTDAATDAPADAKTDAPVTGCDGGAGCERLVFVTSTTYVGREIGGIAGADAKCQARAAASTNAEVKAKRFRAWISTNASAVRDRLVHGTAPYRKPSDKLVATSWTDLTDGTLTGGIDEDENGAIVGGLAWTGSTAAGANGPDQCDAWSPSGNTGRTGNVGGTGAGWSSANTNGCAQAHRLYCFEE